MSRSVRSQALDIKSQILATMLGRIFRRFHRFSKSYPPLRRFIKLRLLKRVAQLIQKKDLPCAIVGGYACEALRQGITRMHDDVDLTLLYEDRDVVIPAFRKSGFEIVPKTPYRVTAFSKTKQQVDLLMWRNVERGTVGHVHYHKRTVVRMPREVYPDRRLVQLRDIPLRIPSNEYLVCTAPFTSNGKDKEFSESLASLIPMEVSTRLSSSEKIWERYQEWLKPLTSEQLERIFRHRFQGEKFEVYEWRRVGST